MDRGIYTALSGAVLQERKMDVVTDNLANINTPGFKKLKPSFEEVIPNPNGPRIFAVLGKTTLDMSQGVTETTGRPFDLAIKGEGFFVVNTPNGKRFTRDGSFTLGKNGELLSRDGHPLMGQNGVIKLTSPEVTIDADGTVMSAGASIDKVRLVTFKDTSALRREGAFFSAGQGASETPAGPNTTVEQGAIEISNVSAIKAMTSMIEAMRSYETHTKMIQTLDGMTRKAVEEVGKG